MKKPIFFLLSFVFVVLFMVSPDSYTHDLLDRTDSAIFFTSGKAWMNGMIPYTDFSDSKGPLLWLIYGIGYLLSPYNYIGIFWMSFLIYSIVYYLVYQISYFFLGNKHLAVICPLIMTLSFFNPWYHYEIRAEDSCQPFIAWSLYESCRMIYKDSLNKTTVLRTFYALGISIAGTLMIKYSVSVMMGGLVSYCFYFTMTKSEYRTYSISMFVAGVSTILLPFLLYFVLQGNLNDFINEYFINTFLTIQDSNTIISYLHEWLLTISNPPRMVLFSISVIGSLILSRQLSHDKYFFLFSFLWFYSIAIHHALSDYYLCICLIFPLWLVLAMTMRNKLVTYNCLQTIKVCCLVLGITIVSNYFFTDGYIISNLFFTGKQYRKDLYNVGYLMSQIKKPTIIYFKTPDHGYGTLSDALPGSKYWTTQIGATKEMTEQQLHDIKSRKSDFIMIDDVSSPIEEKENIIMESGYHLCYTYSTWAHTFKLYTKHNLAPIPKAFNINNCDILFKRNIYDI